MAAFLAAALGGAAQAETASHGIFHYSDTLPEVLLLRGEITRESLRDFGDAMRAHPATVLFLDSPGGRIGQSVDLARMIRARDLTTLVPPGAECASACAFLLLAGNRRSVSGRLGVHQFSSDDEGRGAIAAIEAETQTVVAQIVVLLAEIGASPKVHIRMFETSNSDMYWFEPAEMLAEGIVTEAASAPDLALWAKALPIFGESPYASSPATPPDAVALLPARGSAPVAGPGFDCAVAATATERAICADARLALLDLALTARVDRLAETFGPVDAAQFRLEQFTWAAGRNACESAVDCIETAYIKRLDEIGY